MSPEILWCQIQATSSVWWPGISNQITQMVMECPVCARSAACRKEPLCVTLLQFPWQLYSQIWSVWMERVTVSSCCRLCLSLSWNLQAELGRISQHHHSPEIHLFLTWYTRETSNWQWDSVQFKNLHPLCQFTWLSTCYQQSLVHVSSKLWPGRTVGEATVEAIWRPILDTAQLLSNNTITMGQSQSSRVVNGRCIQTAVPQTQMAEQLTPHWSYLPKLW